MDGHPPDGQISNERRDAPAEPEPRAAAVPPRRQRPADIAIIGMSAIMPSAPDIRRYWENILDKAGAIAEVPAERWPAALYFDEGGAPDKVRSKWGGFLPETIFDPTRFGIPPATVPSIDPAQLFALLAAEAALGDAGATDLPPALRERASVILGFTGGLGELGLQYAARAELARALPQTPAETLDFLPGWTSDSFAGLLPNVVAGRIANRFDFGGANFAVDAACASSLAALRQAVMELESGRSDLVLCGAVEVGQGPFAFSCFSNAQALSPRGACRAFDAEADGTAISEGIAMLVLRRLEEAEAAGDRIYAVIKGIGGSSDGRARGLMAPLPEGQKRALHRAYDQAGYSPASVDLFEAHGTGTVAGDAAEIESLSDVLRDEGAGPRACAVGSVKTLIGHAEGAAGLAGLVKVALGLHHRVLPPHAGVTQPNAALRDPECPIALHQEARPWLARPGAPRRAGVSAFGFGGANFHVTLEEHAGDAAGRPSRDRWPLELFVWRAADRAALAEAASRGCAPLAAGAMPDLGGLSQALAQSLGAGPASVAIVAGSHAGLAKLLGAAVAFLRDPAAARPLPPGVYFSDAPLPADGRLAMLFPGQGSQYPGMGDELATLFPEVGAALQAADVDVAATPTFRGRPDPRLSSIVSPPDRFGADEDKAAAGALAATEVAQPALGAIETAMLALVGELGIVPSCAAGHSYGEYVALHAAGVLSRRDLLRVSEARGRSIASAARDGDLGTMAAVAADAATVTAALGDAPGVVLANRNGPSQTVISGARAAVAAAVERLAAAGLRATPVPVAAAFHSPLMEPAETPLARFLETVAWAAPKVPVYSNTTAAPHEADPARIRALLARHLTAPVDYIGMVEAMYAAGTRVFLEVGPKSVLTSLTRRILGTRPHCAVALDGAGGGLAGLLHALAAVMVQGVRVDLARLFAGRDLAPVDAADWAGTPAALPSPASWVIDGARAWKPGERPRTSVAPPRRETGAARAFGGTSDAREGTIRPVKEIDMHGSHGPVGLDDDSDPATSGAERAMIEHQRTMQQFLQMQERLMLAYLNGGERVPLPRPFSTPWPATLRPTMPRPAPPVAPARVAPPVPAAPPLPQSPRMAEPMPAKTLPALADPKAQLLAIASERTGYPQDMLGLDLNMEADLGIDSIKRVEILAAFRKAQPVAVSEFLQPRMTQISKALTLQEVLDHVGSALGELEGAARPFDRAGREAGAAPLARHVMRPVLEELPPGRPTVVPPGLYVVMPDRDGLAAALTALLERDGAQVRLIPESLTTDEAVEAWLADARKAGRIRGLIGLAAALPPDTAPRDTARWRAGMETGVKALFPLLRFLAPDLSTGGIVVVASAMGGRFGRDRPAGVFAGAGGGVGLVKSLAMEWPGCRCKAVDLDLSEEPARRAAHLRAEIAAPMGRREVGYPAGRRTIFRTKAAPLGRTAPGAMPDRDWVVLAVGGARGITAETLRPFAATGATCVVVGRSPLPPPETQATMRLAGAKTLRALFIAEAAAAGERPTPAAIEAKVASVLRDRETRANLADFEKLGARVDYRICDVRREAEVAALLEAVYARYGRLDAVLLGAGLIEDKLIVDKSRESLARVFDTKVDSAFFLSRHLQPASLKFLALFTSVAGRYGNRGQTDYAAANEVLNRFAWELQACFGPGTKVSAVNWGPWARTTNGPGMLTPETARQFRARGLTLIEPAEGRDVLWNELLYAPRDEVEVVAWDLPMGDPEDEAGQSAAETA